MDSDLFKNKGGEQVDMGKKSKSKMDIMSLSGIMYLYASKFLIPNSSYIYIYIYIHK